MLSITKVSPVKYRKVFKRSILFEKLMALLALLNLILVLFDLSYIPWRDLYYQYFRYENQPIITEIYDPIKGIEINRETQKYLDTVESLKQTVKEQGLNSEKSREILKNLRDLSVEMINQNPFALVNKTGTLERIKNNITEHMEINSGKVAFELFWSQPYLNEENFSDEMKFYDEKIYPLLASNYFRHFAETFGFVDDFWRIDIWFIAVFALEFLSRTWGISRRYAGVSWFDAMLWRWYDWFLLLPFLRFLRVIPVIARLSQAELIDLKPVKKQVRQGLAVSLAQDITQIVVFEVIDQVQDSIRVGDLSKFVTQTKNKNYIDINNVNETAEITKILIQTVVKDVMPSIKPDLEALLQYSIERTLKNNSAYASVAQLPFLESFQKNLTEKVVKQSFQVFYDSLNQLVAEDKQFEKKLENLLTNFHETITEQLQAQQGLDKIESLLVDMLEEIKINYLQKLSNQDIEDIWEKTRVIQQNQK